MLKLPKLQSRSAQKINTEVFGGYNANARVSVGEWNETKNLSTRDYPMMATRPRRGVKDTTFTKLQAIIAKDALYWVDNGTLWANGHETALRGLQTERETQLVSMGAYICVFPDKKYYNTADPADWGSMGADWTYKGSVRYRMCHSDGEIYNNVVHSTTEPESKSGVWVEPDGTAHEYSTVQESWIVIETVYTRLDFTTMGQVPKLFKEMDGVNVEGCYDDDLNGSKILYAVGGSETENDWIVLVGIQEQEQEDSATIHIVRKVPDMDFVCEAQNRLWGCFYGNDGTQNLNEIYCCALGDFKNWEQYLGVATDSWRGSRGSDGVWTGCINYLGTPTFFKEDVIHPVSVSSVGAHQIDDIPARGVQKDCHNSMAIVNETLYYKARSGIVAYQGGMPADVGAALGEEKFFEAAAGAFGQKYYISMRSKDGVWKLFCFDAARGLWVHEDELHVERFAQLDDDLYAQSENQIIAMLGTEGTQEKRLTWAVESGIVYYDRIFRQTRPGKSYLSRFDIRMMMREEAEMRLYIEYDSDGNWVESGSASALQNGVGTVLLPVRPRRCDHLRLKLEGQGDVKIFSIVWVLQKGSDA